VCQNQSIDDSNAPLARDLRILVRERLVAGDNDKETIDYIVSRYGEFVLLRPRFGTKTVILWLAPIILLLVAIFGLYKGYRSRNTNARKGQLVELSHLEREQIEKMLGEK
ncbi:MAG: cytochrome c-type biogenesis protein, partial [Desulfobulbia bacterium]